VSRSSTPPAPRLPDLKAAQSLRDLARVLDLKPAFLSYVLYKFGEDKKYTTFQIPKRNGSHRGDVPVAVEI